MDEPTTVEIWTDGSAGRRVLGYAAIVRFHERERVFTGHAKQENANSMLAEVLAVKLALRRIKRPKRKRCRLRIYSDNQSVVRGINGKFDPAEEKHQSLLEVLEILSEFREFKAIWVKGHSNNRLNNRADRLAKEARIQGERE